MSTHVTLKTARKLAKAAIREYGKDYKVPQGEGCVYVTQNFSEDGQRSYMPVCIVGQILDKLGVDWEEILTLDFGATTSVPNERPIPLLASAVEFPFTFTPDTLTFLKVMQQTQDRGISWSEAYDEGDFAVKAERKR